MYRPEHIIRIHASGLSVLLLLGGLSMALAPTVAEGSLRLNRLLGRSCSNFRCLRGNQRSRHLARKGRLLARRDFKKVAGFSRLATAKGQLFEKDRFGRIIARLFIERRTGRLVRELADAFGRRVFTRDRHGKRRSRFYVPGASLANQQLIQFYLKQLQAFVDAIRRSRGRAPSKKAIRALNAVDRFLGRQVSRSCSVTFDNVKTTLPRFGPNGKKRPYPQTKIAKAGLSFLLNSIDTKNASLAMDRNTRYANYMRFNLCGFLTPAKAALIHRSNPYACTSREKRHGPIRTDWAIFSMTSPENYYALTSTPGNVEELAEDLGVSSKTNISPEDAFNRRDTRRRVVVQGGRNGGKPGSDVVLGTYRTLELQNQRRGSPRDPALGLFAMSYDNFNNDPGQLEDASRNPLKNPFNMTEDAREMLAHNRNGFMRVALFDRDGKLVRSAPGDVAHNRLGNSRGGAVVDTMAACFQCHQNGYNGINPSQREINPLSQIPREFRSFASRFFPRWDAYRRERQRHNRAYAALMRRAGTDLYDGTKNKEGRKNFAQILPEFIREYAKPVSFSRLAKELGLTRKAAPVLERFFQSSRGLRLIPGDRTWKKDSEGRIRPVGLSRKVVQENFCEIKRALGLLSSKSSSIYRRRGGPNRARIPTRFRRGPH